MGALRDIARRLPGYGAARNWSRVRDLRRWGSDDQARREFYAQFLSPGDMCLDVGANLGNRTKVFLKLGARVVAVEPQLHCGEVLRAAFAHEANFTLVRAAAGAETGTAVIRIPEESTIASMSEEWIEAVQHSGRFSEFHWDRTETVTVTTLDALIAEHGVPRFVKVDVEGFEEQVVRGLSQPVGAMSLEFTPERFASSIAAMQHLQSLGANQFNYALGEEMTLVLPEWVSLVDLIAVMERRRLGTRDFGDLYVRFG